MNAYTTLNAWKEYARAHGPGAENYFVVGEDAYFFDAQPRALGNGSLQGRFYRKSRSATPVDVGGFKIAHDGTILALPDVLVGVLPSEPEPTPPARTDAFRTDDVDDAAVDHEDDQRGDL